MSKVYLSVKIESKNENKIEVLKNLKELYSLTHKMDKGCLQYDLFINKEKDNIFHLLEIWQDENSLNMHKEKEHYLNFLKNNESFFINVEIDTLKNI